MEAIIDFETMSIQESTCAAANMSIIIFDRDRFVSDEPYGFDAVDETSFFKLNIVDQVERFGFTIEAGTLDFWAKQPKDVRDKVIKPSVDDLSVEEFCNQLIDLVTPYKLKRWWSRGNNFDPVILKRLMFTSGLMEQFDNAFPYSNMRDTRTFIDAKFNDPYSTGFIPVDDENQWKSWFKHHDSRYDIVADLLRLQKIARAESDLL